MCTWWWGGGGGMRNREGIGIAAGKIGTIRSQGVLYAILGTTELRYNLHRTDES